MNNKDFFNVVTNPWSFYSRQRSEAKGKGQIAFIGNKKTEQVATQLYTYSESSVEVKESLSAEDFGQLTIADANNRWLNIHGLHDVDLVTSLCEQLALDRLTIRQVLDTTLRPKVEEYDHYIFFAIKSVLKDLQGNYIIEQVSFILSERQVISFQEEPADHFDHIRNKMTEGLGLVRKRDVDFLLYLLLDAILDNYFETIELINEEVRQEEKDLLENPTQQSLVRLEQIKKTSEMIKKALNPFKDALKSILNRSGNFIKEENSKYFDDLYANSLSAMEEIDSTIKSLEGLTNIYFSSLSQKMNETMKVLTTVATIFIPLTFIAGIYGMNFEYMPELKYKYGYFGALGSMAAIFIIMILYFKKKKWL